MSWDDFLDIGKTEYKKDEDFVTSSIDQIKSEDVALMIYTSGTTGPPKLQCCLMGIWNGLHL